MAHRFAMLDDFDIRSRLGRVRVPTLAVAGDRDLLVSPRSLAALADGIKGSRLETLSGCGHLAYSKFIAFDFVGTVLYSALWISIGRLVGERAADILRRHGVSRLLLLLGPLAIAGVLAYRLWRRSRYGPATGDSLRSQSACVLVAPPATDADRGRSRLPWIFCTSRYNELYGPDQGPGDRAWWKPRGTTRRRPLRADARPSRAVAARASDAVAARRHVPCRECSSTRSAASG